MKNIFGINANKIVLSKKDFKIASRILNNPDNIKKNEKLEKFFKQNDKDFLYNDNLFIY